MDKQNEDYLIAFAKRMDMALDKVSNTLGIDEGTIYILKESKWAKPIKTPKHITQKLADAREQRKNRRITDE